MVTAVATFKSPTNTRYVPIGVVVEPYDSHLQPKETREPGVAFRRVRVYKRLRGSFSLSLSLSLSLISFTRRAQQQYSCGFLCFCWVDETSNYAGDTSAAQHNHTSAAESRRKSFEKRRNLFGRDHSDKQV